MVTTRWSRWNTTAAVLLLALIAAVVSYSHMYELALRHGEPAWRAALFPLSVDGMVVAASMALLSNARRGRRGGFLPWSLLIIGSFASLAANIAVADPSAWSRIIHHRGVTMLRSSVATPAIASGSGCMSTLRSSAAPKSGRHWHARAERVPLVMVAILGRPEEQPPPGAPWWVAGATGVAILGRPEERPPPAPWWRTAHRVTSLRSSAAPKSGRHRRTRMTPSCAQRCCDPRPPRRAAATAIAGPHT